MRGGLLNDYRSESDMRPGSDQQDPETQLGGRAGSTDHHHHYQRAGYADPMEDKDEYHDDRGEHRQPDRFSWFVLKLTVTSALGGFLFGYDTGVVSGAMLLIKDEFMLSNWHQEVIVSVTIVAAVTAAVSGGPAMERWGRRPLILLAAVIFTVGAVMLAVANSYRALVGGRYVSVGVCIWYLFVQRCSRVLEVEEGGCLTVPGPLVSALHSSYSRRSVCRLSTGGAVL